MTVPHYVERCNMQKSDLMTAVKDSVQAAAQAQASDLDTLAKMMDAQQAAPGRTPIERGMAWLAAGNSSYAIEAKLLSVRRRAFAIDYDTRLLRELRGLDPAPGKPVDTELFRVWRWWRIYHTWAMIHLYTRQNVHSGAWREIIDEFRALRDARLREAAKRHGK